MRFLWITSNVLNIWISAFAMQNCLRRFSSRHEMFNPIQTFIDERTRFIFISYPVFSKSMWSISAFLNYQLFWIMKALITHLNLFYYWNVISQLLLIVRATQSTEKTFLCMRDKYILYLHDYCENDKLNNLSKVYENQQTHNF